MQGPYFMQSQILSPSRQQRSTNYNNVTKWTASRTYFNFSYRFLMEINRIEYVDSIPLLGDKVFLGELVVDNSDISCCMSANRSLSLVFSDCNTVHLLSKLDITVLYISSSFL